MKLSCTGFWLLLVVNRIKKKGKVNIIRGSGYKNVEGDETNDINCQKFG